MVTKAILEKLKSMGLSQYQVQACMETYRDAGEDEALEQAERYQIRHKSQLAAAERSMNFWMGPK